MSYVIHNRGNGGESSYARRVSEGKRAEDGADFPGGSAVRPVVSDLRRARSPSRRDHTLGPLRFSTEEITAIQLAAERAGRLAPGAWAATMLVAVARQELVIVPTGDRARMLELVQARADLARIATLLERDAPAPEVRRQVMRAAQRVEAAADAIGMAQPGRRARSLP